jgi:NAD(P)-dependent dehydrogenase (short-subunit alcohol dehydrogenase family)
MIKKKVAVTGHTRGLGKEIARYYKSHGFEVIGFSKSTGYDISDPATRAKIIEESKECKIFVNNAMAIVNDSQTLMLKEIFAAWRGQPRIIVNISSISGDFVWKEYDPTPKYSKIKHEQDIFCASQTTPPSIINLKPGTLDTDLSKDYGNQKMNVSVITDVLDFIRNNADKFVLKSATIVAPNNSGVAK